MAKTNFLNDKKDTKRTPDRTKTIQKFNKKPENKSFQKFNGKPENKPFKKFHGKPEDKSFKKFHGKPDNKSFNKSNGKPDSKSFQKFKGKPEGSNQRPPKVEEHVDENDVRTVNYVLNPKLLQKKKMEVKELEKTEKTQVFQQKKKKRNLAYTRTTNKGQPIMGGRMKLLYEKIQKNFGT
ncbi:unnamed protein product [Diamesa serratosioi]